PSTAFGDATSGAPAPDSPVHTKSRGIGRAPHVCNTMARIESDAGIPFGRARGNTVNGILIIGEAPALLKLAERNIYLRANGGELPGRKTRSQWRIRKPTLDRWIAGWPCGSGEVPRVERRKPASPGSAR